MIYSSDMNSDAAEDRKEDKQTSKETWPLVGKDDDVYFFNPWDRHFAADRKSQRSKFDF